MKDGYAGLYDDETEDGAKKQAIVYAKESIKNVSMSPEERRNAIAVDSVKCLG